MAGPKHFRLHINNPAHREDKENKPHSQATIMATSALDSFRLSSDLDPEKAKEQLLRLADLDPEFALVRNCSMPNLQMLKNFLADL
jgi:hypothetical protein